MFFAASMQADCITSDFFQRANFKVAKEHIRPSRINRLPEARFNVGRELRTLVIKWIFAGQWPVVDSGTAIDS
jgi:hypothetical protein